MPWGKRKREKSRIFGISDAFLEEKEITDNLNERKDRGGRGLVICLINHGGKMNPGERDRQCAEGEEKP